MKKLIYKILPKTTKKPLLKVIILPKKDVSTTFQVSYRQKKSKLNRLYNFDYVKIKQKQKTKF